MIIPKKKLKLPDTRTLDRLFLRFIDKNDIEIESPSDVAKCSTLFARCISEYFNDKLGDES